MCDGTRIRMVARTALVELDTLVDDGLRGPALDLLIESAEALAIAPFARVRPDPFPYLCELRDVLETIAGRTAANLVETLDDLIARAVRIPVGRT